MTQDTDTQDTDTQEIVGLPYDEIAEQSVIGSVLINEKCYDEIRFLSPDDFYIHRNRWLWQAIVDLNNDAMPVDFVTVRDRLHTLGQLEEIGGPAYLASLINYTPTSLNARAYARIVMMHSNRRRSVSIAQQLAQIAFKNIDPDKFEEERAALTERLAMSTNVTGSEHVSLSLDEFVNHVTRRAQNPSDIWGLSTGFIDIDYYTGGLQEGELFILGGEPGVGKSKLAWQIAWNVATNERKPAPVVYYSLEMSREALNARAISAISKIPTVAMNSGQMSEWDEFYKAVEKLSNAPMFVETNPISIEEMRADLSYRKSTTGVSLAVVDYLLLLKGNETLSEIERSANFARGLKTIARVLGISVICIISVTKAGMDSSIASMTHVRGSGEVIHAADIVAFLKRKDGTFSLQTTLEPVEMVFTKTRNISGGMRALTLLADRNCPIFHDAKIDRYDLSKVIEEIDKEEPPPPEHWIS